MNASVHLLSSPFLLEKASLMHILIPTTAYVMRDSKRGRKSGLSLLQKKFVLTINEVVTAATDSSCAFHAKGI